MRRKNEVAQLQAKVDILWDIITEMDKTRYYNDELSNRVDVTITAVYKDMYSMEDRLKKVIENGISDITHAINEKK